MAAIWTSSAELATERSLGLRCCHWQYPVRDTSNCRHIRATLYRSRFPSIQTYFTATPSQNTPPLFLRFLNPVACSPALDAVGCFRLPSLPASSSLAWQTPPPRAYLFPLCRADCAGCHLPHLIASTLRRSRPPVPTESLRP